MKAASERPRGPGILFISMPFSSPASYQHAENLLVPLAASAGRLFVLADPRITLRDFPEHVRRCGNLPVLHYLGSKQPQAWSIVLWLMKLAWILLRGCWAVVQTRRSTDVVLLFPGTYTTPVLLTARLCGKKTAVFWVNSDTTLARAAYGSRRGGSLLVRAMQRMENINQHLADICAVESLTWPPELHAGPSAQSYSQRQQLHRH